MPSSRFSAPHRETPRFSRFFLDHRGQARQDTAAGSAGSGPPGTEGLLVRHGKGGKDWRTMSAKTLLADLRRQLDKVRALHRREL
jgi:hypothetical protein